jgi:two-component system, LytTR family, response regulator LytT
MEKPKVLIVEDELIIATHIQYYLEEMDCLVIGQATKAEDALNILHNEKVDLVLLDIIIKGEMDGIELGEKIQRDHNIPFIFLTSHADRHTVDRAIKTQPAGYIVKPFEKTDIYTSVKLALAQEQPAAPEKMLENNLSSLPVQDQFLILKFEGRFIKVSKQDILYIRSVGNYLEFHTTTENYLVKGTMKQMLEKLEGDGFLKTHKSYMINFNKIESFNNNYFFINGEKIPLGRSYKDKIFEFLNIS